MKKRDIREYVLFFKSIQIFILFCYCIFHELVKQCINYLYGSSK